MLDPSDFRPRRSQSIERWAIATIALEFWEKWKEPVGPLLRAEILDYANKANLSQSRRKDIEDYAKKILNNKPVAVEAVEDKVLRFKKHKLLNDTVQTMIDLQAKDQLSDARIMELCSKAVSFGKKKSESIDYFAKDQLEKRIKRRQMFSGSRYPLLMIDPVDQNIRVVARGQVGLFLGSWKVGKSMFAVHLSQSYALQALNTIYFTLEDSLEDVEDRLDASLTALPLTRLFDFPNKLKKRFLRMRELMRGRIRVVDLTDEIVTVSRLEAEVQKARNEGFMPDAMICDYDKDIKPTRKYEHRWEADDEIYMDYRRLNARYKTVGWILAQAKKGTNEKKVITGDDAEGSGDKLRRVHCALSGGVGDWGEDSVYLYVAAHKNDRKKIGWNIMGDRARGIFYDPDATREMQASEEEERSDNEKENRRNGTGW